MNELRQPKLQDSVARSPRNSKRRLNFRIQVILPKAKNFSFIKWSLVGALLHRTLESIR